MCVTNPLVVRNRHKYREPLSKMISVVTQPNAPPRAATGSEWRHHRCHEYTNTHRMSDPIANAYRANASLDTNAQGAGHNDQGPSEMIGASDLRTPFLCPMLDLCWGTKSIIHDRHFVHNSGPYHMRFTQHVAPSLIMMRSMCL